MGRVRHQPARFRIADRSHGKEYAGDRCLFHSIKEEEFNTTWSTLKIMVGLMKTDYTIEDLSYEELTFNKDLALHSSH